MSKEDHEAHEQSLDQLYHFQQKKDIVEGTVPEADAKEARRALQGVRRATQCPVGAAHVASAGLGLLYAAWMGVAQIRRCGEARY